MIYTVDLFYGNSQLISTNGKEKIPLQNISNIWIDNSYKIKYVKTIYVSGGHGEGNIPKHIFVKVTKDYNIIPLENGELIKI